MTPNKQRALQALLTQPNKTAAAQAAGVSTRTLQSYLADADFQAEYTKAARHLVIDAARQAQLCLSPTLTALRSIVEDEDENTSARTAAGRTLLEYGLRLTEITDILLELATVDGDF